MRTHLIIGMASVILYPIWQIGARPYRPIACFLTLEMLFLRGVFVLETLFLEMLMAFLAMGSSFFTKCMALLVKCVTRLIPLVTFAFCPLEEVTPSVSCWSAILHIALSALWIQFVLPVGLLFHIVPLSTWDCVDLSLSEQDSTVKMPSKVYLVLAPRHEAGDLSPKSLVPKRWRSGMILGCGLVARTSYYFHELKPNVLCSSRNGILKSVQTP